MLRLSHSVGYRCSTLPSPVVKFASRNMRIVIFAADGTNGAVCQACILPLSPRIGCGTTHTLQKLPSGPLSGIGTALATGGRNSKTSTPQPTGSDAVSRSSTLLPSPNPSAAQIVSDCHFAMSIPPVCYVLNSYLKTATYSQTDPLHTTGGPKHHG